MATRNTRSSSWTPDARAQLVLATIIREHLVTGEPVGSRTVSERCAHAARWSPATIRNVMAELEEAGLVEQPHTSAGRVPTDKGYRFYVDHMLGRARVPKSDVLAIERALGEVEPDPERLMERASHLLSELTDNVGIVFAPPVTDQKLQHVEFVRLTDGHILVVLVFAPNIVQHRLVRLDESLEQEELDRAARYLNEEFRGQSLHAIRAELARITCEQRAFYDELQRRAALLCERSLADTDERAGEVYIDGTANILTKPDFADLETLRALVRTLEEKRRLIKILNECLARERSSVQVIIGREHRAPIMRACSLVAAPYRLTESSFGALCIMGPMRIEYERIIGLVGHVARVVERKLNSGTSS